MSDDEFEATFEEALRAHGFTRETFEKITPEQLDALFAAADARTKPLLAALGVDHLTAEDLASLTPRRFAEIQTERRRQRTSRIVASARRVLGGEGEKG